MERRDFIRTAAACGTAVMAVPLPADERMSAAPVAVYDVTMRFDLSSHRGRPCALWVPVPADIPGFQQVLALGMQTDAAESYETSANTEEARTVFARWNGNEVSMTLTISLKIALRDRTVSAMRLRPCPRTVREARRYVLPSSHIPTDGAVARTARAIVGRQSDPLKKARLIYAWVVANSYRDESVRGCGVGSPDAMLAALEKEGRMGGKCLDMSALCVALMRAAGIPAREVLGIRVGASRLAPAFGTGEEITRGQHCKVEFFVPTVGWIPCDPADITKLVLKEGIAKDSPRACRIADKFFGFWENNWMALNHGRDFDLYPVNAQGTLDQYGYPYAEVDGEYLDPFDPAAFRYNFTSRKAPL